MAAVPAMAPAAANLCSSCVHPVNSKDAAKIDPVIIFLFIMFFLHILFILL
jgi:hypothetical protein